MMSEDEQIKAQDLFSAGFIYTKYFSISGGKKQYYVSDGNYTIKINKTIYEFIKGLER